MSLERVGFISVPAAEKPGFDHADIYRPGRRIYVAHTGADRVDVIDCRTHTFLRSLQGLPGVAGVLIDEEHDLLFTSDRGAARVSIFRCSDEQLLAQVEVGPHPNGLAYNGRSHSLTISSGIPRFDIQPSAIGSCRSGRKSSARAMIASPPGSSADRAAIRPASPGG